MKIYVTLHKSKVIQLRVGSHILLAYDSKYLSTLNKTYKNRENVKSSNNNETQKKCLDVTPHFLQSKLIFKFRWTGLTITIFTVKMPQGSYKRTKYAVNLPLYCVQLYGFVPGTKLPNWASNVKEAFFQNLSITMLCLSLDFHFVFSTTSHQYLVYILLIPITFFRCYFC